MSSSIWTTPRCLKSSSKNDRLLKSDKLNLPSTRKQRKLYPPTPTPATHTHTPQLPPGIPSSPLPASGAGTGELPGGVGVWVAGQGPLAVECGHHGIPEKEQKAPCLPSPEQSTRRKSGHSALGFSPQETRALQGLPLPLPHLPGTAPREPRALWLNRKGRVQSIICLAVYLTLLLLETTLS